MPCTSRFRCLPRGGARVVSILVLCALPTALFLAPAAATQEPVGVSALEDTCGIAVSLGHRDRGARDVQVQVWTARPTVPAGALVADEQDGSLTRAGARRDVVAHELDLSAYRPDEGVAHRVRVDVTVDGVVRASQLLELPGCLPTPAGTPPATPTVEASATPTVEASATPVPSADPIPVPSADPIPVPSVSATPEPADTAPAEPSAGPSASSSDAPSTSPPDTASVTVAGTSSPTPVVTVEPALAELTAAVPAAAAPSPPVPVPPAVDADRPPPPAPPGLVARAPISGVGISGPLELAAAPVHLSPAIPAPVVAPLPELAPPVTLGTPADDLRSLLPELEPSAAPDPVAAVQTVTGRTAEGPWVSLLPAAVAAGLTAGALGACRRRRGQS